jgi:hypothetical protein
MSVKNEFSTGIKNCDVPISKSAVVPSHRNLTLLPVWGGGIGPPFVSKANKSKNS